jgi:hypothetical protein
MGMFETLAKVIAEAEGDKGALIIATRDGEALAGGPGWGRITLSALVSFEAAKPLLTGEVVGMDRLQPSPGAVFQVIEGDLDGDLVRFGMAVTTVEGKPKHGRVLTIRFADGSGATVLFDQGFGAWDAQGLRVPHDFMASPAQQVNALGAANASLKSRPSGTYVVAQSGVV